MQRTTFYAMEQNSPEDSFKKARNLLIGAVDTVIKIAAQEKPSLQKEDASTSKSLRSVRAEHQRLFGFKPSKIAASKKSRPTQRKPGKNTWRKECICLRDREQEAKPSAEEKMELAKMGLGLTEVVFNSNGDAEHIHNRITMKFPVLECCGGYTLLRLGENSRSLVEIETPESGLTVPYLKDILNQAKLYIRPLQIDITDEAMKPYRAVEVNNDSVVYGHYWLHALLRKMSLSPLSFA